MFTRLALSPRYTSPSDAFLSMQRALHATDDLWAGTTATGTVKAAGVSVKLDAYETNKAFFVTADLPGMTEKDVEVSYDDGLLTIIGEKKLQRDEKADKWHIVERSSGSFTRKLSLNTPIDVAKIEAKFEKGVLSLTLPKLEQAPTTSHKIEIKTA